MGFRNNDESGNVNDLIMGPISPIKPINSHSRTLNETTSTMGSTMTEMISKDVDKNNATNKAKFSKCEDLGRKTGILGVLKRHVKFLGPGVVASAAYYDPGNWATDLEAGSRFGNSHLFILIVAIVLAVFLQILASRLGFISRKDIAENCREGLYSRKRNPLLTRWLLLYPLWLLFEIGILFADIGELLGSAIAYTLLFPQIPIWGAVLLTFPEVFLSLIFFRGGKQSKQSMKIFEAMITIVVMAVVVASLILFFKVKPNLVSVLKGYIPSAPLVSGTGFYTAIGIIGATVGPHSLILGSALAKVDVSENDPSDKQEDDRMAIHLAYPDSHSNNTEKQNSPQDINSGPVVLFEEAPTRRTVRGCQSYIAHASFDIAASLLTLPLIVNSAILSVASTTYFYSKSTPDSNEEADIASMHQLLSARLGHGFGTLFAIALLLSALAASLTITIAGQAVSAGFLQVHTSPLIRRLITRTLGIIPSAIISAVLGKRGVNQMLIASQVALSIVLPFAIIPLAYFTSKQSVMSIPVDEEPSSSSLNSTNDQSTKSLNAFEKKSSGFGGSLGKIFGSKRKGVAEEVGLPSQFDNSKIEEKGGQFTVHSFSNHITVKLLAIVVVLVVTAANGYGVYQAVKGDDKSS